MLKLQNGPADVAKAAHEAGIAESFPGVDHTLSEDGQGGPPNNGVVLGQYQSRVIDMASAYATIAASGVYHKPHFVQKVVNSRGEVLFDAAQQDNQGEQRIDKKVADNVIAAMQPIAAYSNGHALAGGRASGAKTGTNQLGDTGANRDAWMVGFTPSLSTAVWVGTTEGTKPLENKWGSPVYGSGLPSDIWKSTMDGALEDTENETFPKPEEIGGYAGVPQAPAPPPSAAAECRRRRRKPSFSRRSKLAPGVTIPWGPPTTVPVGPPVPVGPCAPARRRAAGVRRRPRFRLRDQPRRRGDDGESADGIAGPGRDSPASLAADRRSLDDRDLPSRTDRIGAASVRGDRRACRQPRTDRQATVSHAAAGDADHRAGVPRARLLDQSGVPADHRHGHRRPTRRQLGQPAGVLRALLLRHRSPLHRRTVEPRQVPLQVQLDREGLHGQAAHPVRREHRGAVHGVSGADGALPVRVDGVGQVLPGAVQAGHDAGARRGGDVLQHRRVRVGAGVDGDGVGDVPAGRPAAGLGRGIGGGVADRDLPDLHQLRRAGNGFRDGSAAGVGPAKTGVGRRTDRPGRGGQAVSTAAARSRWRCWRCAPASCARSARRRSPRW